MPRPGLHAISHIQQLKDDANRTLETAGIRTMHQGADAGGRPLDPQVKVFIASDGQSVLIQVAYPEFLTNAAARDKRIRQLAKTAREALAAHGLVIDEDPDKDRPRFASFVSGWFGVVARSEAVTLAESRPVQV